MIPTKPGFYWVTDTSGRQPQRTIVEVYETRRYLPDGEPVDEPNGVSFLGSDMDGRLPVDYLTDWSGPLEDPGRALR